MLLFSDLPARLGLGACPAIPPFASSLPKVALLLCAVILSAERQSHAVCK